MKFETWNIGAALLIGAVFVLYARNALIDGPWDWALIVVVAACIGAVYLFWFHVARLGFHGVQITLPLWIYWLVAGLLFPLVACAGVLLVVENVSLIQCAILAMRVLGIVAVYACMSILFFISGDWLLRALQFPYERIAGSVILAIVVGMCVAIIYFYVTVLLGYVSLGSLLLYIVAVCVLGLSSWQYLYSLLRKRVTLCIREPKSGPPHYVTFAILLLSLFALFGFLNNALPQPFDGDSLRAYFNVPYLMSQRGGMVAFPHDPYNNAALASSFLYLPLIILGSGYLNYINVFIFILTAASIYFFANHYFQERAAFLSVLMFLTVDLFIFLMISLKSDYVATLLFLWSAILCVWAYREQRNGAYVWAGFLAGIACAVKYNILIGVVALGALLVGLCVFKRQSCKPSAVAAFVFGGVVGFAPWGIYSLVVFGSPLFPYTFFGASAMLSESASTLRSAFTAQLATVTHGVSRAQGVMRALFAIVTNDTQYPNNKAGPFVFSALVLGITAKRRPLVYTMLAGCAITWVVWYFISGSQVWYAAFAFPFMAIMAGVWWSDMALRWARIGIGLLVALLLVFQIPYARVNNIRMLYAAEDFGEHLTPRDSIEYRLNELEVTHPEYLLLPFGPVRYALVGNNDRHLIANLFFETWVSLVADTSDADAVWSEIKKRGITHVYYHKYYMPLLEDSLCKQPRGCVEIESLFSRWREIEPRLLMVEETDMWKLYEVPNR